MTHMQRVATRLTWSSIVCLVLSFFAWEPVGHASTLEAAMAPLSTPLTIPKESPAPPIETIPIAQTVTTTWRVFLPMVSKPADIGWPMLGANPQRTSWTREQVPSASYLAAHRREWGNGMLYPQWYRPFEPYINGKIQVIAANGLLYISTARGLYALRAENGDTAWVYPTDMPLGHSPTVAGDVLYVGGYDRKIHALNALTGQPLAGWSSYEAEAGFETNPLLINGRVYAGSRDGYFYALDAATGGLEWRYKTDGPILYSAAYMDGVIYFASNDAHAYALDEAGQLVWKSAKLPGAGFHSYWPVIYEDWVIFSGSHNYLFDVNLNLSGGGFSTAELHDVYPNYATDPRGTLVGSLGHEPGNWTDGTLTLDAARITRYFENKPWRRTYFALNRFTGQELTFDSNNDGVAEYAPILWTGTHSGNRYPPTVGSDGVLYQFNNYLSDPWIAGGQISGWKLGTKYLSIVNTDWGPVDEPHCASAGGNLIYWQYWYGHQGGAFDISVPVSRYPDQDPTREWSYYDHDLDSRIPNYRLPPNPNAVYGSGTLNCPIPYRGRVYMLIDNTLVAWGLQTVTPVKLPIVQPVPVPATTRSMSVDELKQQLAGEVQAMLSAGHLRPGYHSQGLGDLGISKCCKYLVYYFGNPSDTQYTLIRALPYLPADMQQQVRTYLQQEFAAYPPYAISNVGWKEGAAREAFDLLPEVDAKRATFDKQTGDWADYWTFPQYNFYALWKYAQVFGNAQQIFNLAKGQLETPPSDAYFQTGYTHILNAYIAGYIGYLNLQQLAGYPESANVRATLNHLLDLRATTFSKDHPAWPDDVHSYMEPLDVARNFMYLTPELADYLRTHALAKVQAALDEYQDIAPYWFVTKYDATWGEGVLQQLFDYPAIFQAKAMIMRESRQELTKYLDVPAFARGDLFYIQNLVAAIEAPDVP